LIGSPNSAQGPINALRLASELTQLNNFVWVSNSTAPEKTPLPQAITMNNKNKRVIEVQRTAILILYGKNKKQINICNQFSGLFALLIVRRI
jgi:hypothetical protein